MSTQLIEPPAARNGHDHTPPGVRTYRGRKLEELIPKIRADLGPNAIILRQREGLMGGVGGFFAQRCVEVDARAGTPRVDLYDEDHADDMPPAPAPPPAEQDDLEPADETPTATARWASFADSLAEATEGADDLYRSDPMAEPAAKPADTTTEPTAEAPAEPAAATPAEPARAAPGSRRRTKKPAGLDGAQAGGVARELIGRGISEAWAHDLIVTAAAHGAPFARNGGLRAAVRATLASALPAPASLSRSGAAIALVGPGGAGKTRCVASLAAAYRDASTLSVGIISVGRADRGGEAKELLRTRGQIKELLRGRDVRVTAAAPGRGAARAVAKGRDGALVLVDTAAVSPGDSIEIRERADQLKPLALDAVYIAVPATLSAPAARQLVESLAPMGATGIVITHADETDQHGVAAELAHSTGIPVTYIHEGLDLEQAVSAADPFMLANRLLP